MEEKMLTFEEKLDKLLETAKKKKNVLEEQEILDVFAKEELTPEKLDQIYDFLDNKKVDVLKISSDDDHGSGPVCRRRGRRRKYGKSGSFGA